MNIESTNITIKLTIREAQSLWKWLEEGKKSSFRVHSENSHRDYSSLLDGQMNDCDNLRNELENMLSEGA